MGYREWMLRVSPGALLLLGLLSLCGCLPPKVENGGTQEESFTVSPLAYETLQRVQKALSENDTATAYANLERMREREDRFSTHERTLMWQVYAQMYADSSRFQEAANCLQYALGLGALPEQSLRDARYDLGQMYVAAERYQEAAEIFSAWLQEAETPTPQARYTAAVAFFESQRYAEALSQMTQAIRETPEPSEAWLQLLSASHLQLKQYVEVLPILHQLLTRFPKKTYWLQLASVYGELQRGPESLAAMEILERQGELTTGDELRRLAQLYMQESVPTKAVALLQAHMRAGDLARDEETLELLADALLMAHEKAEALAVLRELSDRASHGRADLRIAYLWLEDDRLDAALRAARKAIERGGLRSPGQAQLLLGTVEAQLGHATAARAAFERAAEYDPTRAAAEHWLQSLAGAGGADPASGQDAQPGE